MAAQTVMQNLQAMLSDAIALRRPATEVDAIRRQLASYAAPSIADTRAAQIKFIAAAKAAA